MSASNCSYDGMAHTFFQGLECGGHGKCINGTCVCDLHWTGSSDVYNLKGTSCHLNNIVIKAFTGIAMLMFLQSTYVCFSSALTQWRAARSHRKTKSLLDVFGFPPIRIFGCLILSITTGWVYLVRRMVEVEVSLGDDVLHTLSFGAFVSLYFVASNMMQFTAFKSLFRGLKIGVIKSQSMRSTLRKFKWSLVVGNAVYVCAKISLVVVSLLPNANKAPWLDALGPVLVANNLAVFVTMFLLDYWNKHLLAILHDFKAECSKSSGDSRTRQLEKTIDFLTAASRKGRVASFVTIVLYVPLCVPYLWGYQDYTIMIACLLLSMNITAIGKVYSRTSETGDSTRMRTNTVDLSQNSFNTAKSFHGTKDDNDI